jgi:hypothetical protein
MFNPERYSWLRWIAKAHLELRLDRGSVAILRILNGRSRVDNELPGLGKAKERTT